MHHLAGWLGAHVLPIFRIRHRPTPAAVHLASCSVPAHLSARGLAVPVWAALLLPAIALLPLLSPWASYILAPAFALAAALRLAALAVLAPPGPPPLHGADLPTVTVLVPLFREVAVVPDLVPALARLVLPFLLGGTSNWFRASALRAAVGWDAQTVTEDAVLGVRLARLGWRSSTIDSTR